MQKKVEIYSHLHTNLLVFFGNISAMFRAAISITKRTYILQYRVSKCHTKAAQTHTFTLLICPFNYPKGVILPLLMRLETQM